MQSGHMASIAKASSVYENTRIGTLFSEVSVLFNMVQCARRSSTAYDSIAVFADLVTSANIRRTIRVLQSQYVLYGPGWLL